MLKLNHSLLIVCRRRRCRHFPKTRARFAVEPSVNFSKLDQINSTAVRN